jgi:5-hydroxyisourate hydrolase
MKLNMLVIPLSVTAVLTVPAYAADEAARSPISVHVLDISRGKPAAGMTVLLERADAEEWRELSKGKTDVAGRIETLLPQNKPIAAGTYRVTFQSGAYFAESKTKTLYPRITVIFEIADPKEHYHIPLLLSPFGYSTYRGN